MVEHYVSICGPRQLVGNYLSYFLSIKRLDSRFNGSKYFRLVFLNWMTIISYDDDKKLKIPFKNYAGESNHLLIKWSVDNIFLSTFLSGVFLYRLPINPDKWMLVCILLYFVSKYLPHLFYAVDIQTFLIDHLFHYVYFCTIWPFRSSFFSRIFHKEVFDILLFSFLTRRAWKINRTHFVNFSNYYEHIVLI